MYIELEIVCKTPEDPEEVITENITGLPLLYMNEHQRQAELDDWIKIRKLTYANNHPDHKILSITGRVAK